MNNRFAMLYLDDESDERSPAVECIPTIPSSTSAFTKVSPVEKKSSEKKKEPELRDFGTLHTKPKKDIFQKRNPFRKSIGNRYAFKDDVTHRPLVSPIQVPYKFLDEAVPLKPFQTLFDPEETKDLPTQTIHLSTIGNTVKSSNDLSSLT